MFFNYAHTPGYPDPRGHFLALHDPYHYVTTQPHHYYAGYRPQVQAVPAPRPYLTITQFNYQPIGFIHGQPQPPVVAAAATTANVIFGPPPRERRYGTSSRYRSSRIVTDRPSPRRIVEKPKPSYQKKQNNLKSDSTDSFEFTIPPEQIVNLVCDDKELECTKCKKGIEPIKPKEEIPKEIIYCSPTPWPTFEILNMDPMRIDDNDLTKFIVEGCLKAEAIAVRNQHRPCFKNIKHLCTRTRTDITKPRTTVANIHSQGIPWATKDFIFAFVRLINCWYILKGYLDDHEGILGKIEAAMIPEFKECYQRWQTNNKDMVRHLINIFVNLDNGVTVQNAEIFSSFNSQKNMTTSSCSLPCENRDGDHDGTKPSTSKSCPTNIAIQEQVYENKHIKNQSLVDLQGEQKPYNNSSETCLEDKLKYLYLDGSKSVPGILRVKDMFTNPPPIQESNEDNDKLCNHHKIYMKPGSYRVPKKSLTSPMCMSPTNDEELNIDNAENNENGSDLWKSALECFGPFMESFMKDSTNNNDNNSNCSIDSNTGGQNKDTQVWVNENYNEESIDNISNQQEQEQQQQQKQEQKQELQQQQQQQQKGKFGKKYSVSSRTYRKRMEEATDDVEYSTVTNVKMKNSREYRNARKTSTEEDGQIQTVNSMCFLSRKNLGLAPDMSRKFEEVINALWNLEFARYVTFEVNAEHVPDYYKYITKPMFLYKIMNKLKQNKYTHPFQVVHDLRTIIRNSELYVEKRPDWWYEKCLIAFSKELEAQLAEKFISLDFSSITGDPMQPPEIE